MLFKREQKIEELKKYFAKQKSVLLAFLFGSFATGRDIKESDIDIALYLKGEKENSKIESAASEIVGRKINFTYLHSAPATQAYSILETGIPLLIRDKGFYWDFCLPVSMEAEDFRQFTREYQEIYQKS